MIAARRLGDRLHLQHGPIDLVIGADPDARECAFAAATRRFETVLAPLTEDLQHLRRATPGEVHSPVAKRMVQAVSPHGSTHFVTPMAAVAGAVADEVLGSVLSCCQPKRVYVNNGGDIALHLAPGQSFAVAVSSPEGALIGRVSVSADEGVGGIATSGQGGRSFSLGIAESVTVLAKTAASADVAATLIANAVDIAGHPAIRRVPAEELDPQSDLGHRRVVTSVGALTQDEVSAALMRGQMVARQMLDDGLIIAALLSLRGLSVTVGDTRLVRAEGAENA